MSPGVAGASQSLTFGSSPLPAAATFMEHWKRKQMRLNYRWDLTGFEEEEVSGFGAAPPPPVSATPFCPRPCPVTSWGRTQKPEVVNPRRDFSVHLPGV